MSTVAFEGVTPIFRVQNVSASVAYYTEILGFTLHWSYDFFASISRGRCCIFLSSGDQGHPGAWAWVGVSDAEALHAEYIAAGAHIRHPPTNYAWALEMQIEDPDGNILRMGSDSKDGEPYGEWLDMYGKPWPPTPAAI